MRLAGEEPAYAGFGPHGAGVREVEVWQSKEET
jgi:hypothetical protein